MTVDDPSKPVWERSYSSHTPDGAVWLRVAAAGNPVGIQVQPSAMASGARLAARIMACSDVGYFEGQLAQRAELVELFGDEPVASMATHDDLIAAVERLNGM